MSEYFHRRRNINVLFLGGAKRVALAEQLIKAGKEYGIEVSIFSHELDDCEPIASVGKIIIGNKYSSPGIDAELDKIIEDNDINVVLPFIDPAIEVAARCKTRHADVFVPVSDAVVAHDMFDKVLAARLFESLGIPVPETYTPDNMKFPAILKPRCGSASQGIIIAENETDLRRAGWNTDDYLIQRYVADREEYTVDCYVGMQDGEVKCAVPRLRIATAGGEVTKTETRHLPLLEEMAWRVLKMVKLQGAVTLQFIRDLDTGHFLLMEVNPRLGGGVICSIYAGANIAKMILEECIGFNAIPAKIWHEGVLMTRYMKEVVFSNDKML